MRNYNELKQLSVPHYINLLNNRMSRDNYPLQILPEGIVNDLPDGAFATYSTVSMEQPSIYPREPRLLPDGTTLYRADFNEEADVRIKVYSKDPLEANAQAQNLIRNMMWAWKDDALIKDYGVVELYHENQSYEEVHEDFIYYNSFIFTLNYTNTNTRYIVPIEKVECTDLISGEHYECELSK
jgi:hypothetical protein